jgi:histidine triad (HIT) family protein
VTKRSSSRGGLCKLRRVPGGKEGCIFCAIATGDGPAEIVDSDERTVAFMDINPATRGHALVIPRAHAENLFDVSEEDLHGTMSAARRLARRMRDTLDPDGINILNSTGRAAWQSVFHFHLHVIPRYHDDPLELPWIPAPADRDELSRIANELRSGG